MLELLLETVGQYEDLLVTISIISAAVFAITLLLTPYLLGLIPVDYFSEKYQLQHISKTPIGIINLVLKTILGIFLVLAGIIMLVTPGQGVISILLGLFLMEFPGKRKLEQNFINHEPTYKALNWLRNKAGKPPFIR